ncbi:hypothetical protein [Sphingomonas koreensis]
MITLLTSNLPPPGRVVAFENDGWNIERIDRRDVAQVICYGASVRHVRYLSSRRQASSVPLPHFQLPPGGEINIFGFSNCPKVATISASPTVAARDAGPELRALAGPCPLLQSIA